MPITLGNPFKGRHYSGEVILSTVRPHDAAFYSPVQLPVFFDPAAICPVVVSQGGREPEMMIPFRRDQDWDSSIAEFDDGCRNRRPVCVWRSAWIRPQAAQGSDLDALGPSWV